MSELKQQSAECTALTQLMVSEWSARPPVAHAAGEVIDWQAFAQRVSAWAYTLSSSSAQTVAVYLPDSVECAAVLLALWHTDKVALLCGDNLAATTARLPVLADAVLGDFPRCDALPRLTCGPHSEPYPFAPLNPAQRAVVVLTSGTTGEPKPIPFTLRQLDAELALHEQLWGEVAGDALVVGTVTHQHIYGLLWRLLWPLSSGRTLLAESCHYQEDLRAQMAQGVPMVLVTTPTHLSRLPEDESLAGLWTMVVSSTAPLPLEVSQRSHRLLDCPVVEIYGSSETGGIAWRQQYREASWQPLPGIEIRREAESGALQISSPILPDSAWLTLGDRAELLPNGGFKLLGRLDRIAKIEGKRLSLEAMERQLLQHPWLQELSVLVLEGRRTECAVVAVLTTEGANAEAELGKARVCRQLREWLSDYFETPLLPRRWRFVDELPRNPQGKLPLTALKALFESERVMIEKEPSIQSVTRTSDDQITIELTPAAELEWFKGHFKDAPILPGVVQVHWAAQLGERYFATPLSQFARMEVVKFQQVVRPEQAVTLTLTWKPESHKLVFRFAHGETVFSSGRLVFTPVEGSA